MYTVYTLRYIVIGEQIDRPQRQRNISRNLSKFIKGYGFVFRLKLERNLNIKICTDDNNKTKKGMLLNCVISVLYMVKSEWWEAGLCTHELH